MYVGTTCAACLVCACVGRERDAVEIARPRRPDCATERPRARRKRRVIGRKRTRREYSPPTGSAGTPAGDARYERQARNRERACVVDRSTIYVCGARAKGLCAGLVIVRILQHQVLNLHDGRSTIPPDEENVAVAGARRWETKGVSITVNVQVGDASGCYFECSIAITRWTQGNVVAKIDVGVSSNGGGQFGFRGNVHRASLRWCEHHRDDEAKKSTQLAKPPPPAPRQATIPRAAAYHGHAELVVLLLGLLAVNPMRKADANRDTVTSAFLG